MSDRPARWRTANLAAGLLALAGLAFQAVHAQDCAEKPGGLDYLGRAADKSKSYWISVTKTGAYRLSAPGVPQVDAWSTPTDSARISVSPVVKDDLNGNHKLDRMKADGSFDCFLHSRNQTRPLLPPTWRPPAKPTLPVAVKPELPDRPTVIRPEVPGLPTVVRPQLPDRPVVVRPDLPQPPTVVRPEQPDRPVAIRPELPERPAVVRPERPVVIELQGQAYEMSYGQVIQYCPSASFDRAGSLEADSLQGCTALFQALRAAPLTPGRDLVEDSLWNAWVDLNQLSSTNRRGVAEISERAGTLSLGLDRKVGTATVVGLMLSISDQRNDSLWGQASSEQDGWLLGPYASVGLGQSWTLFGSALFGRIRQDQQLLSLSGTNTASQVSLTLNAQGNYPVSERTVLRPRLGINYLRQDPNDFYLTGPILGLPARVLVQGRSQDTGQIMGSIELNSSVYTGHQALAVAFLEAGVINNYLKSDVPQDPRWQGLMRVGLRVLVGKNVQVDLSVGSQSVGVSDLSIWDAGLLASYAF